MWLCDYNFTKDVEIHNNRLFVVNFIRLSNKAEVYQRIVHVFCIVTGDRLYDYELVVIQRHKYAHEKFVCYIRYSRTF